jgi:hypothetical protein
MNMRKAPKMKKAPLVFALALAVGPAGFAPPSLAQGVVYIPPGANEPRFGGEILLTETGPVVGYWTTQCRTWRIRSQARRGGPMAPPDTMAAIKRFIEGLIAKKPNYDDLSPAMAGAVRKNINTYWPSFNRMGRAKTAKQFDADQAGNRLYVVNISGGKAHWNIAVNADGKIDEAFVCAGEGL